MVIRVRCFLDTSRFQMNVYFLPTMAEMSARHCCTPLILTTRNSKVSQLMFSVAKWVCNMVTTAAHSSDRWLSIMYWRSSPTVILADNDILIFLLLKSFFFFLLFFYFDLIYFYVHFRVLFITRSESYLYMSWEIKQINLYFLYRKLTFFLLNVFVFVFSTPTFFGLFHCLNKINCCFFCCWYFILWCWFKSIIFIKIKVWIWIKHLLIKINFLFYLNLSTNTTTISSKQKNFIHFQGFLIEYKF